MLISGGGDSLVATSLLEASNLVVLKVFQAKTTKGELLISQRLFL